LEVVTVVLIVIEGIGRCQTDSQPSCCHDGKDGFPARSFDK